MTKETSNTLPDMTVTAEIAEMAKDKPDIDVGMIRAKIKEAASDIPSQDREQQTLAAKLAGYASEYVEAALGGYFTITRTPAVKHIGTDGTVSEVTEEIVKRTFVPPKPDLSVKEVTKFIREAMDVRTDEVMESTKDAKVKGAGARSKTVDVILPIAARAAMLIATNSDGATLAFFIGNRHVELDAEGKPPRGAVLAVAGKSNALFPHFAGPNKSMLVNPSDALVRMASEQIRTSFAHHFEGKARDGFGKIARGTREKAGNESDTDKAIAAIPGDPASLPALVSKLLPIFERAVMDPTEKSAKELSEMGEQVETLVGLLDKLLGKIADYNDDHPVKIAA